MKEKFGKIDKAVFVFVAFSLLIAYTFEFWWLTHVRNMGHYLLEGNWLAKLFALYGQADPSYVTGATLALFLEGFNVCAIQPLLFFSSLDVIRGESVEVRFARKTWTVVGSWLIYSVILYYSEVIMRVGWPHGLPGALFWLTNAPWLVGGILLIVAGWKSPSPQANIEV